MFGLAGLTPKELRQCRQGTEFSLQALYVAAFHLTQGGLFLSEHPARPADSSKASIWSAALIDFLLQAPECKLQTFSQWKWGSATPKPTGLFSIRLPHLARSLSCADPSIPYPSRIAQGLDEAGKFNTAACKEYPPLFCKALARAITDSFDAALRSQTCVTCTVEDASLHQWMHEAALESSVIHDFISYRPDFQGY